MATKLEAENSYILDLIQAMLGAISQNFRRVTLEITPTDEVRILFLLEQDLSEDREEIDDIAFEFAALQDHDLAVRTEVVIDSRPIQEIGLPGRAVFGRRE